MTTTFKVQPPTNFTPAHRLYFNPNPAVLSTNGTFVTTLYAKGWGAGQSLFGLVVSSSCASVFGTGSSPTVTDGDGNFAAGIAGTGCSAGTVKLLIVVGTSSHLITLHLAAPSL